MKLGPVFSGTRSAAIALCSALVLSGCGGGGSSPTPTATATPAPSPSPTPTPTPSTAVSCSGLDLLDIAGATANQTASGLVAANTIDDDLGAASRWSAPGVSGALTLDLGDQRLIREVGIAWELGDQRTSTFTLEISSDGSNFTALQGTTRSSGDTLSFERYDVTDTTGRFVRVSGTGTSDAGAFGVVEAAVFGCAQNTTPVTVTALIPVFSGSIRPLPRGKILS